MFHARNSPIPLVTVFVFHNVHFIIDSVVVYNSIRVVRGDAPFVLGTVFLLLSSSVFLLLLLFEWYSGG